MSLDYTAAVIAILAAILSGMGTAIVAGLKDNKKERIRKTEREQDHLKLDLKDLKIELYKIERELTEWKDKYYETIQELIKVKSDLEEAMIQLTYIQHLDEELDTEF